MIIGIHSSAESDIFEGFCFYEAREPGLGDYFLNSILSDIDSLKIYAGIHPLHWGYFRMPARRFPFAIYYRTEYSGRVIIYGVIDCRQDPEKTIQRLNRPE